MIKRLPIITGVGCYSSCRSAEVQFEKMSLIYGENCYGKSTLCDILRSLAENIPTYITDRPTLPALVDGGQQVQVCVNLPDQAQETQLTFRHGSWNPELPQPIRIDVFDTDFIHRNVFTGLSIERHNHENITRFILGDTGVRTATRIGEINSSLRSINRSLREAEAGVFSGIEDLPAFLELVPPQDLATLGRLIAESLASVQTDRNLAANLTAAQQRQEPTLCQAPTDVISILRRLDICLSSTYAHVHRDAEARMAEHLQNHTLNPEGSRNWVRQGTEYISNAECPYCGQQLIGTASDLISAYQTVFNEEFEQYITSTIATLETAKQEFEEATCSQYPTIIEHNRSTCLQYPELQTRPNILTAIDNLNAAESEIQQCLEQWTASHERYTPLLTEAVQHKKENAHTAIPLPNSDEIALSMASLTRAFEEYNQCLMPLSEAISAFKTGLDASQVEQRIQEGQQNANMYQYHKRRLELDAACRTHVEAVTRKVTLESESTRLQDELAVEQTTFLTSYLDAINRIFTDLGSNRFTIDAESSRRGNMPTIQLRVSYNGVQITQDRLHTCFSESDRRALAFAIFWARIEMRDAPDRLNTIVVLDDPVTSFDDARIDRTIRLIESQLANLRQVIILSHYSAYLKTFFTRLHGQQNGVLLATLYQDGSSTQIRRTDPLDFIESAQQRAFRNISGFIARDHTEDVLQNLRVFLETEVRSRYYQGIIENNLQALQFASLLDNLEQLNIMSAESRRAIEPLRTTLNTDHHVWMDRNQEEKIGIARDVLQLIYRQL
jgi:wobble nucleotide-excising tRNase